MITNLVAIFMKRGLYDLTGVVTIELKREPSYLLGSDS